jgi:hypothetical protein
MKRKTTESDALRVTKQPTETDVQAIAYTVLRPTVQAACTLRQFNAQDNVTLNALVDALAEQSKLASEGKLDRAEAMLVSQAHTLDTIFNSLARRAAANMGEYLQAAETYMRLALRAQSQSRATLETLSVIKNPPVLFAKQANIAHGHQQVNNGNAATVARGKTEKPPTELLEHDNAAQRLDFGTARTTGASDPPLAAVEAIDRTANEARKAQVEP